MNSLFAVAEIEGARCKNQAGEMLLATLTTALKAIDEEKERMEQEARISKAVRARAEEDQANKAAAACILQSYWRGIRQREEYVASKKAALRSAKKKKSAKK